MLCVTLNKGGYFMIGDDIMVTFLKTKETGQIEVGISAPRSVAIKRDKLVEAELSKYLDVNMKTAAPKKILIAHDLLLERNIAFEGAETGVSKKLDMRRKAKSSAPPHSSISD